MRIRELSPLHFYYDIIVKGDGMKWKKIKSKTSFKAWVYIILRILVILCMMRQMFQGNILNSLLCIVTLILFSVPTLISDKLNIELPDPLEIIILLFIFSAEILGEINEFYIQFKNWDLILHTTNGFIMAGIGYSLVDLLNRNEKISLSPIYIALVSICFSMTIGVFWEFFEYGADQILGKDMQKDTIIHTINSVTLNPDGKNEVVSMPLESVTINGEDWIEKYGGYIDIGLHDTMQDLFVNFIGAFSFSLFGYVYSKGKDSKVKYFIPKRKKN